MRSSRVEPWATLLPPLDPTTMGWSEREWYLGPYKEQLFDTAGNAGPTVWWDGRIVGGWRQSESGDVDLQLLEDVGAEGSRAVDNEAARLTEWLEWHSGPAQVPVTAVEGVGAGSCRGIGQRRKRSRGWDCRRARDLVRGAYGGPAAP
jgi:hypothetical protein